MKTELAHGTENEATEPAEATGPDNEQRGADGGIEQRTRRRMAFSEPSHACGRFVADGLHDVAIQGGERESLAVSRLGGLLRLVSQLLSRLPCQHRGQWPSVDAGLPKCPVQGVFCALGPIDADDDSVHENSIRHRAPRRQGQLDAIPWDLRPGSRDALWRRSHLAAGAGARP